MCFLIPFGRNALAQAPATITPGCGPAETKFDVQDGKPGGLEANPSEGKAAVYIIGYFNSAAKKGTPTIRIGLDGSWIGATKHNAYLRAEIEPGNHHYCAEWQSIFKRLSDEVALYNFIAEPGHVYFLRAAVHSDAAVGSVVYSYLDLAPVSEDEGRLLLSESVQAVSHAR